MVTEGRLFFLSLSLDERRRRGRGDSDLLELGGFDPRLIRNQDNELADRVRSSGRTVFYDAELVVGDDLGSFWANGYEGQRICCVPALDLVFVRLGKTPAELGPQLDRFYSDVVAAFLPD